MSTNNATQQHDITWGIQVWVARKLTAALTIRHVEIIAHVTGAPVESIFAIHPCHRSGKQNPGIAA